MNQLLESLLSNKSHATSFLPLPARRGEGWGEGPASIRYIAIFATVTVFGITISSALADVFTPIAVTGYSWDMVIEASAASGPLNGYTTATMAGGTANTAYTWFEQGYDINAPNAGLPPAGSVFASQAAADHFYQMPPSYATNNAIFVQTNTLVGPVAVAFSSPASYASLSFLGASANGPVTNRCIIQHLNGVNEVANIKILDWNTNQAVPAAWVANGAVILADRSITNENAGIPALFSTDFNLTDSSPVTNINISWFRGPPNSRAAIFAISGATTLGGQYNPIALAQTSFNRDIVIETNAPGVPDMSNLTTASMDGGAGNTGGGWYERGLNTGAPSTGLPLAGTTFTSVSDGNHQFRMPPSYTHTNNAVMIDQSTSGNFIPVNPAPYSALSFLTSAGNAQTEPMTISYTVWHADGTTDTGTFDSYDWFKGTNLIPIKAWISSGRVANVGALPLTFNNVGTQDPSLYQVDVTLANTTSPVTNIDFTYFSGGNPGTHAAIFAVSGVSTVTLTPFLITSVKSPTPDQLVLTWNSVAGHTYQVQSENGPTAAAWTTNATVLATGSSTTYTNTGLTGVPRKFYRVVGFP